MSKGKTIYDIMTERVVSVNMDTPVTEAAFMLSEHGFNGLPVVDAAGRVAGIFSERHLVTDRSYLHLKTLLKLFSDMKFYKKDSSPINKELQEILELKVKDVMNPFPTTVRVEDSIEEAARLFANPNNNPLPVVDGNNNLRGIVSLSDLTKFYGIVTKKLLRETDVDMKIDKFVKKFDKEFLVVTRLRASTWFIFSVLFSVVGFAVAMMLILRIA